MSALQRRIIEFLDAELVHSLGSYRVARDRLGELQRALEEDERNTKKSSGAFLDEISGHMRQLNHVLNETVSGIEPPGSRTRQPFPEWLPFSHDAAGQGPEPANGGMTWVDTYYGALEDGLKAWARAEQEAESSPATAVGGHAVRPEYTVLRAAMVRRGDVAGDSERQAEEWVDSGRIENRARRMRWRRAQAKAAGIRRLEPVSAEQPGETATQHTGGDPGGARSGGHGAVGADDGEPPARTPVEIPVDLSKRLEQIDASHLESAGTNPLAQFVIRALTDAHMLLHVVESHRSRPIGDRLPVPEHQPESDAEAGSGAESGAEHDPQSEPTTPRSDAEAPKGEPAEDHIDLALKRSIALNTFVWTVCRSAPWVFAENDAERARIADGYASSWRNCRPMRAMWIGTQLMLLALYRRSHALMLDGDHAASYQDLHKLQATIREVARRLRQGSMQVDGATGFLETLDALADFRIGMLYRASGDQSSTLKYLERSQVKLERLKRGTVSEQAVVNSRWVIKLQLGLGKSSYQLGQHKAALRWYLLAWRSLLELLSETASGRLTIDPLDAAIDWLSLVVDEPELHKLDLIAELRPAIDQIEAFRVDERYRGIAAEILLRLGHLLFILDLGDDVEHAARGAGPKDDVAGSAADVAGSAVRDEDPGKPDLLSLRLLRRAFVLDSANTLASSNLMRAALRTKRRRQFAAAPQRISDRTQAAVDGIARDHNSEGQRLVKVEDQWPGGQNDAEALSHLFDAILLRMLWAVEPEPTTSDEDASAPMSVATFARGLLTDFLLHTDSIEARKGQVYANLAKRRSTKRVTDTAETAALEFICLRRYSSAYPILPRPREFRADGGGYFVRVHPGNASGLALGIAVDPGTGYIDCLYREGLSVADIDVILVTHDHVDHASALEPLLAVRHEARSSGGYPEPRPLWILGNRSISDRLMNIHQYQYADAEGHRDVTFVDLSKGPSELDTAVDGINARLAEIPGAGGARLQLAALPSVVDEPDKRGHRDASNHPSIGLLIELCDGTGERRSIAIGGDLPRIPAEPAWSDEWKRALGADVFVAHLSTVPMTELRRLADLDTARHLGEVGRDGTDWLNDVALGTDVGMKTRFTYALWLASNTLDGPVGPVEFGDKLDLWRAPAGHPYLEGTMNVARAFAGADVDHKRLRQFVVGELSEELGSVRTKVALWLERALFDRERWCASTSDIGMRSVLATHDERGVRMECSTCALDYDRTVDERIHPVNTMTELCVKGENEGVFYSCRDHQPDGTVADPRFIERHERFDLFGR